MGDWTFTPDRRDVMVADVLIDTDFLDFGFWVRTDNYGDSVVYRVSGFFRGEVPRTDDMSGVFGGEDGITATYRGGAAGLYTKRELAVGNDGDVTAAGRFTATAVLTANFGADGAVPMDDHNKISGTISNFRDGGQMISAWEVKLMNATFADGTFMGVTTGGTWDGQFFGGVVPAEVPTGVAGKFTAGFLNGDLVGAFGAEKQRD